MNTTIKKPWNREALATLILLTVSLLSFSNQTIAASEPETETLFLESTIKGNVEQPSVIYILPWQEAELSSPDTALTLTLDQLIKPIQRETFQQEVRLYQWLRGSANQSSGE